MRNNGFTLVEVMLALVVTVMASTLIAQGFGVGARASVASAKKTRAVWLAGKVMTDVESGALPHNRTMEATAFEEDERFSYAVESRTGDLPDLFELAVTVTWEERGRTESYTLWRLLYRPSGEAP